MNKKQSLQIIAKIIERADNMGVLMFDRLSLLMDLEYVSINSNLNLSDLLNANNFNFTHDISGIQNNMNRQTKTMENSFVPLCAR